MTLNLSVGLAQDIQKIQLKPRVARLVVTDLIKGDAAKEQLIFLDKEVNLLKGKISVLDSIIVKKDKIIFNYEEIIGNKDEQLNLSLELTKKLQFDLKKQKAKTKIFKMGSGAAIVGILALSIL